MMFTRLLAGLVAATLSMSAGAAAPDYVRYKQQSILLSNVRLVDGTGGPARENVSILIDKGRIAAVAPAARLKAPKGATVIDGRGKTVLPGLVFMHEHMFYPAGELHFGEMLHSFPLLYLAGGVTTARTGGTLAPYADLNLRDNIAAGLAVGPDLDVTGPYIEGKGLPVLKINGLADAADAERFVNYWADEGATSFKAYMMVTRDQLRRAIETAHRRNTKVTGHLCSVTYREAADLGIDNLEHGFGAMTDFIKDKKPDTCPFEAAAAAMNDIDPDAPAIRTLMQHLIARKVAVTSTLVTYEDAVPGRPKLGARARSMLLPKVQQQYDANQAALREGLDARQAEDNLKKMMKLERLFVSAGGTLLAGTDPTGVGGVVPGFASKRQIQLLVEAGFRFEEAIRIATLNGARYLGREREIGSVEPGKRADLVLIDGDPIRDSAAIERMPIVFKAGIGYDSEALIKAAEGLVGLR